MKIEVPRKTAYYKKIQAGKILSSMGETFFVLKDCFFDFLAVRNGSVVLIKSISSDEKISEAEIKKQYKSFDREIWRFFPIKKIPVVSKFPKEI